MGQKTSVLTTDNLLMLGLHGKQVTEFGITQTKSLLLLGYIAKKSRVVVGLHGKSVIDSRLTHTKW